MMEKNIVVYDLRLAYNGPVKIVDFFKEVEDWIKNKGMQKEIKKKTEHLTPNGKKVEWTIECWRNITTFAKEVVRLRAMFNDVKEIEVERDSKRIKIQQTDAFILLDGILETDLSRRWEQTPWFYFLRAMFDKYIWKFYTERYNGIVTDDTYDLHKTLKSFFDTHKLKVQ